MRPFVQYGNNFAQCPSNITNWKKNKRGQEKIKDNNEIPTKESQHIVKTQYNVITNL